MIDTFMQNRRPFYIVIAVGLVIIGALLFSLFGSQTTQETENTTSHRGVTGEPIDVALDFFGVWLEARQSTTTDPYAQKITDRMEINGDVAEKLLAAEASFRESGFDPVLCQNTVPEKLRAKPVYEMENVAEILIMPRDKEAGIQTLVALSKQDGLWAITNIKCGSTEEGPEQGEFNFEKEGFLLKQSVQPPLNPEHWHLVFEQGGVMGHTVPMFFSDASVCVMKDGEEQVCNDSFFMEAMKVKAQGNMTEAGLEVARLTRVAG